MFTLPFMVGKRKWGSKPTKDDIKNICQWTSHYIEKQADIKQIYEWILEGRCWRSALLKNRNKDFSKENSDRAYVIALDFDMCDIAPETMLDYCGTMDLMPNFWYYSFSQGIKQGDNYRLVWVLDKPIPAAKYEAIYRGLLKDGLFKYSDKSCSNINRLWFGTCNGGELLNTCPITASRLEIYATQETDEKEPEKKKRAKKQAAQGNTQADFIMNSVSFEWWLYLQDVCDLWDRWRKGIYLNYNQRLVLFTELKCLKYAANLKNSILDKVMEYYKPEVYASHTCDRYQISQMMGRGTSGSLENKIVRFSDNKYTISEYFNSGAYIIKGAAQQGERITIEELQKKADEQIPAFLQEKGGIKYIECQTGAGKTERIINYLLSLDLSQQKIIYSVPTYGLIDEFIERLEKTTFDMNCLHYPKKQDYAEGELILLEAGFFEGIKTDNERQAELKKVYNPSIKGLFLLTHACLTHLHSFEADVIIIDENIEETIVNRNAIPLTILSGFRYYVNENGRQEWDKLCDMVNNGAAQQQITGIDIGLIFSQIDYKRLVKEQTFIDSNTGQFYPFGKLRQADYIAIGQDKDGNKYLYFEITSKLLPYALANNISVKLFTGTAKKATMQLSLPEELRKYVDYCVITRAKPKGKLYQYTSISGSKYSLKRHDVWNKIIAILEKNGVDWRNTNTLTLKAYEEKAHEMGFKIPKNRKGDNIHIENCAGLDFMKGQDLIIIGKSDKPKEVYFDMIGDKVNDRSKTRKARLFEDVAGIHLIHGFNDNDLWQLQVEQMRQMVEQAADRARMLWFDNVRVFVFCDLPIRDAIYMEE